MRITKEQEPKDFVTFIDIPDNAMTIEQVIELLQGMKHKDRLLGMYITGDGKTYYATGGYGID